MQVSDLTFADPHVSEVIEEATLHILFWQFVSCGVYLLQVTSGSGMGFYFSGEVADAAFIINEMELPMMLCKSWRDQWGIRAYFRYRDDCFLVQRPRYEGHYEDLKLQWSHSSCSFHVDKWEYSEESVVMLDAVIFKQGFFLAHKPHFKESSLGVPLAPDSLHQTNVHLAWMKSEIRRFSALSSDHDLFHQAKDTFMARLHRFLIPNTLTTVLDQYDPFLANLYQKSVVRDDIFQVRSTRQRTRCLLVVLRWAPQLSSMSSLYRNIMSSVDVQTALDEVWSRRVFSVQ